MTYQEALAYISATGRFGVKLGLERTRALLDALGSPDRDLRGVLVAGTNGKGSVCADLVAIFTAAGYRVGSMPKPHLQSYTERVCVDGRPIARRDFARLIERLQPVVREVAREHGEPTEFEMLTAAAIKHLRDARVDLLVCEVGMGGRLDSTNVLDLGVKVVTSVQLDHQAYLGDTIAAIAGEKAGIIRAGDSVMTAQLEPAAARVVAARSREKGARLARLGEEWRVTAERDLGWRGGELTVEGPGTDPLPLRTRMLGAHQRANAALAAAAALEAARHHALDVGPVDVRRGITRARWPGRLEPVASRPRVLLDGGHNPDAVARVVDAVEKLRGRRRVVCLFGAMSDKDWPAMLSLLPRDWTAVFTAVAEERACDPSRLLAEARRQGRDDDEAVRGVRRALRRAEARAGAGGLVLVLGSLYLAGAVRASLGLPLPGTAPAMAS